MAKSGVTLLHGESTINESDAQRTVETIDNALERYTKRKSKVDTRMIRIMEHLDCKFHKEFWFDEEGIEGTRITLPNDSEIQVYGHDENIDIDEVLAELDKLTTEKG
jgi:hypothetical protein